MQFFLHLQLPSVKKICMVGWVPSDDALTKNAMEQFLTAFIGLAYQGKDIVFTFILEYSSLWDFGP
jgi:hypothetical protein